MTTDTKTLLDSLEPDAKVVFFGAAASNIGIQKLLALPDGTSLYSRETVEHLLVEHRKQVLREAAEKFEFSVRAELRRMANSVGIQDGNKVTYEGEK